MRRMPRKVPDGDGIEPRNYAKIRRLAFLPAACSFNPGSDAMNLKGSCHCKAVNLAVESAHPYPFNLC